MTASAIQRGGAFTTRRFVIPAGQERQFDCDAVQLLVTELDNAAQLQLQLNGGDEGRAWKGFEATGRILHVAARNTAADPITVEFLLVSPGLLVRDRRLNQVGDLGLVTTFDTFQPVGIVTIPGQSVRLVAAADAARRFVLLSNPPGQFREIYISGAEVENLDEITFGNPDFEDATAWTNLAGGTGFSIVAAGPVITGPQSGLNFAWQDGNVGQTVTSQNSSDLVSAQGFSAADIDTGLLTYEASIWAAMEAAGSIDLELTWKVAVGGATVRVDLLDNAGVTGFATAGWQKKTLTNNIPATARAVTVLLRENGGSDEKGFDTFRLIVNGVPPDLSEMAGFIMPSGDKLLPSAGAIYAYNPHSSDQDLMVGEIRG